jgi:hypothetical protein
LLYPCRHRSRDLGWPGRAQQQRDNHDHEALAQAEPEVGSLVAAGLDHAGNGHNGQGRARAEACGGEAGGKPAPIREPFQRVADGTAQDRTGAHASDDGGEVEQDE